MSDPRFARLKSDPRFRRPKKHQFKVAVDDRFKSVFEGDKKGKKKGKSDGRVDKYGRTLSATHEKDDLRRFYRLEDEGEDTPRPGPDLARGEVLLESSDEEEEDQQLQPEEDDSDADGPITLGRDPSKPIRVTDADLEIDLDEDNFADLDAQAAAYSNSNPQEEEDQDLAERTRRIAAVNLDWDHVRAVHLYRICSSVVSLPVGGSKAATSAIRGKLLNVRVYPSQFGKERMEKEEREGPPVDLFKKKVDEDEEVNETNIYETGDANEYDEEALRKYQLERLRYYYAIIECDSVQTASYIYNELQGTELERSANVFDLSFVPDDMTFDDDFRDEATAADLADPNYKGLDFVTDALRHSKVKLTWDQDDPERDRITRRALSRKEIEENDFRAYIASSSDSEPEDSSAPAGKDKAKERDKLRALLLGGGGDDMPEGWGGKDRGEGDAEDGEVDMEVTFMPALSGSKKEDETTLEKYQRKMREKRKKRKEERKGKGDEEDEEDGKDEIAEDEFFGDSEEDDTALEVSEKRGKDKAGKKGKKGQDAEHRPSTKEELELLVGADSVEGEPQHFDMKAVLKAEKKKGKKSKKKSKKGKGDDDGDNELQEDFKMDVADNRFKALYDDHQFAIDPSNPHFKKTKAMSAVLQERSKRNKRQSGNPEEVANASGETGDRQSLQSLVESVKRKSAVADARSGKRQKL